MKVATLSGKVVDVDAISDQVRVAEDGTRYYLANGEHEDGGRVLCCVGAAKAWRVRTALASEVLR